VFRPLQLTHCGELVSLRGGRGTPLDFCFACCSVLQCVAVCCSVLQCVAVCCSVLKCVTDTVATPRGALCCSVLQCVTVCCTMLQCNVLCVFDFSLFLMMLQRVCE